MESDAQGRGEVTRHEGGDDVFGIDDVAHQVVMEGLRRLAPRWPGTLIIEGSDASIQLGDAAGPWVFLVDPLDGTRPWLAGKRSAWVLLGAGRNARSLEDLEVGAALEVPNGRARWATVASAVRGMGVQAEEDDLAVPGATRPVHLRPSEAKSLARTFVTVARFSPGDKEAIGRWEDELLRGVQTYEDPYLCTGGQLMGLASGSDAAVLDPRPHFGSEMCAHPYDLAALVVAREAGVIVESLSGGPFTQDLDPETPMAWAGFANATVRDLLRSRMEAITPGR